MKIGWATITWAYLVEPLLAGLLYGVAAWFIGFKQVACFIQQTGAAWANMTGVLFAASLTIWVAFVNVTTSDFGGYLRFKKVYGAYSAAFVFAMFVFFFSTALLIIATANLPVLWGNIALGFLIYAAITVITMVRNATGLVKAHATFKAESAKVTGGLKDDAEPSKLTKGRSR